MSYLDAQWGVYPPFGDASAPGHRREHTLSGTGTTESVNEAPLAQGRNHMIHVGAVPVRVSFRIAKDYSGAAVPASGGVIIPANSMYPFKAVRGTDGTYGSLFVHAEAADGTSAYELTLYQRD